MKDLQTKVAHMLYPKLSLLVLISKRMQWKGSSQAKTQVGNTKFFDFYEFAAPKNPVRHIKKENLKLPFLDELVTRKRLRFTAIATRKTFATYMIF